QSIPNHRDVPSSPTRRSSDLSDAILEFKTKLPRKRKYDFEPNEAVCLLQLSLDGSTPEEMDEVIDAAVVGWLKSSTIQDQAVSLDRKSTRLNSSHVKISYAVF